MPPLALEITEAAHRQLAGLPSPLEVQLELLFSCLVRKRVLFQGGDGAGSYPIPTGMEQLRLHFRPVMTRSCRVSDVEGEPDLEAFPVQRAAALMPRWFRLDFHDGRWQGDFGWSEAS